MLLNTVYFVMSYTWKHRTFMTGHKMAENIAPAVLDVSTKPTVSLISFDFWFWISAEAQSVHIGLSGKYGPLHKSLITLRPLYLCPAGEQEVLNLATIERLWRLYSWADTPQQTPAISRSRNITPDETNIWSYNENSCLTSSLKSKGEKGKMLPSVTRFQVHFCTVWVELWLNMLVFHFCQKINYMMSTMEMHLVNKWLQAWNGWSG